MEGLYYLPVISVLLFPLHSKVFSRAIGPASSSGFLYFSHNAYAF